MYPQSRFPAKCHKACPCKVNIDNDQNNCHQAARMVMSLPVIIKDQMCHRTGHIQYRHNSSRKDHFETANALKNKAVSTERMPVLKIKHGDPHHGNRRDH